MLQEDQALFTIGAVAELLEISPRTLRGYEKQGLLEPRRSGKWRYYSADNVKWLGCLQELTNQYGLGGAAITRLLRTTPCWDLAGCLPEKRRNCTAFLSSGLLPSRLQRQCQD